MLLPTGRIWYTLNSYGSCFTGCGWTQLFHLVGRIQCKRQNVGLWCRLNIKVIMLKHSFHIELILLHFSFFYFFLWMEQEIIKYIWTKIGETSSCCIIGSTNPCRITRKVEQTKMYVCTLEEFILVDIWIHCCASWNCTVLYCTRNWIE